MKSFLYRLFILFFYFSFLITNCQGKSETPKPSNSNLNPKTIFEFCESFALKYTQTHSYIYKEKSSVTVRKNFIERGLNKLSDFVSPKGSRFTDGYDCLFQAEDTAGVFHNFYVGLFLAETYDFAKYTIGETKIGSLIPIEYIISPLNKTQGYGVFKFLKIKEYYYERK